MSEGWIERVKVAASDMITRVESHLGSLGPLPGGKRRQIAMTISGLDTQYQKAVFASHIVLSRPLWWVYADFHSPVFSVTVEPDAYAEISGPKMLGPGMPGYLSALNAVRNSDADTRALPPACEMPASSLAVNERLEKLFGGGA